MKVSIAVLAAAAGVAMAKPEFLNSNFDVTPGQPFTLKFKGCDSGCSIILLNGDPKNLKPVQTLIENTTGPEETITLSPKFDKDTYAFEIKDSTGGINYSEQFTFDGAVPVTSAAATSTPAVTSTSVASSSTEATTTMITLTSDTKTTSTPAASTTVASASTSTSARSSSTTTASDNDSRTPGAAARVGASHVTFAVAAVALVGYFL